MYIYERSECIYILAGGKSFRFSLSARKAFGLKKILPLRQRGNFPLCFPARPDCDGERVGGTVGLSEAEPRPPTLS